jgi:hypothetical protein
MSPLDRLANQALIGQWLGVLGMLLVFGLMLRSKAKDQRKKAERRTHEQRV